ncbi:hypothetical protein [Oligoflexus tunisiensis]|uniref:hypothetical protein n=1 Tax=Oligoflexus tunisiensis TaxID=708132 RepID=UPI00114CE13B|nr:hypothetical protein [Oligoflexus tunisiensis]
MRFHRLGWSLSLGVWLVLTSACGKKSSSESTSETDTSITLTGQLSLTGGESALRLAAPAITDLSVYCVTFSVPPIAGTGDFDSEGKFSVTLDTTGVSVGCFILDSSEEILGTLVFKDPTKTDLKGGEKSSDRLAFEGGESDLGAIVLNLDTGKAEVDISKIVLKTKSAATVAAEGEAFDFTGSYKFAASGLDAPVGYENLCTQAEAEAAEAAQDWDACSGPVIDMPIYLKRLAGKSTADGSDMFALSIWASKATDDLCGNKLGFTYAEGKEHGIDFSASGIAEGDFTWKTGLVDGWKDPAARARNGMMKMENVDDFNGYAGMKQYFKQYRTWTCNPGEPCVESAPTVAEGFTFNANTKESGCRDGAGKPVQLSDWSNMECTNTELTGGLHKNVCKKTVDSVVYTCTNIMGTFLADGTSLSNAMTRYPDDYEVYAKGAYCDYNGNSVFDGDEWPQWNGNSQSCNSGTTITQGELCSSIATTTEGGKLAQLRCYADALHGDGGGKDEEPTACIREINTNWSASTAAEFLLDSDGPSKARGQFIMDLFEYDSATSGSLRGEDRRFEGIQVGNNWTDCEIQEVFSFSLKKIDDSGVLYGEMIENSTNVSPKPACVAEYGAGKTRKFMFTLVKQP